MVRGSLVIRNKGGQAAGRFTVAYYLSDDGMTPDSILKTASVFSLSAGASRTLSFSHFAFQSLQGKYIIAFIDSGGVIGVTDETNNLAIGLIN